MHGQVYGAFIWSLGPNRPVFQQSPGLPGPVPARRQETFPARDPCVVYQLHTVPFGLSFKTLHVISAFYYIFLRKSLPATLLSPFKYGAKPPCDMFHFSPWLLRSSLGSALSTLLSLLTPGHSVRWNQCDYCYVHWSFPTLPPSKCFPALGRWLVYPLLLLLPLLYFKGFLDQLIFTFLESF